MSSVFDMGGQVIPMSQVKRAEKTDLGKLRVHMKDGDFVMVPKENAEAFVDMFKAYIEKQEGH